MSQVFFIWDIFRLSYCCFEASKIIQALQEVVQPGNIKRASILEKTSLQFQIKSCNSDFKQAEQYQNEIPLNVWTSCQEWDSLLGHGSASVVDQECRLSQG